MRKDEGIARIRTSAKWKPSGDMVIIPLLQGVNQHKE
jgi:hypothetical protein